ncbi:MULTISPECIES: Ig-like domain-containing protein, partial [unclassified Mesorhizobium]|uniref:beta strand repeat-containing protein n=1 Tax=unclassified Mesorhizobium TaxID=325217 RepID=UPI000BDD207A
SATEGGAAIVANAANGVLANDHVGADQPGTVTAVTGGTVGNPIATAYGTLTLNSDGSYVYTPKASVPDGTVDSFTYTMKDADGDTSQAVLSFTFSGDNNHATAGVSATLVDEDDLATGNHDTALGDDTPSAQPGTLTHNYGADGAGHIALVSGSETVNGTTYTYTANGAGTQIIASAGGVNVFQVDLTNAVTGTYTVTLLSPVQHPIAGTEDNLAFNLSYKVYDADDTAATAATGTLTVTVDDDIPVAVNDGQSATEGGAAIVANAANGVLANDHVGADQPGTVTAVTGGTVGNPIATAYGTLTLNSDGSYVYTPKASVPDGTVDSFTYTMKDADGDTSQAVLSFTFSGDNNHATAGVSATLVDEDDLATGNHDTALGDDTPSAQPGTLTHNYGADGAGHIALVSGSETVNGTTYTYTANGAGTQIIASAGGVNVFQVDLTNAVTGTYTVTLLSPVQHPIAGTEDNLAFNLSYKVYDADDTAATAATGTLTVTVDDDIPVAKVVTATPVLDDDAQTLFTGNPGGTSDVADAKVLSGGAGSLFTVGADGLKALSFAGPNVMAIYKTPSGLAAQEGVQYATTTNAGHTILTATGVISGSTVFVLDVAPDGSYAFTLSEPLVHPTVGTTEETMNVTIGFTVTDGDSDAATGSLTVQVNDDTPTFTHITNGIVANQDNNVVVGTHNLAFGADGEQSIEITPLTNISGLTYLPVVHNADGSADLIAQAGGSNFFDLKINADGTYKFTLIESRPVANQTFDFSGVSGGASTIQFTLGDATFKAVDTNNNGSIGSTEELKPTSNGFGVQNGNLDVGEQFQVNFATAIDKLNFFVEHEAAGAFTMTWTTNTGQSGTATTSVDGLLTIDPTGDFTSITFTVTEGKAKFDNFGYSKLILPSDQTFNFSVSGVDGDGDHSASQTLSITALGEHPAGTPINGTAGDDAITGTSGSDTINGLAGADTMTGGAGADSFIIGTGESTPVIGGSGNAGTISGYDIITDFVAGTDKLTLPGTLVAATAGLVDGAGDSVLTIGGDTVESHSVTNGIASFFGTDAGASPLAITTTSGVAAAVQYLMGTDIGNAGATLAFTATISGVNHTYVYTQTTASAGVGALVDLQGVTVANLNTLIGGSVDPVILDLNHNGFTFSDVSHGVQFDMNGDGTKEQLAWNTSKDGMLAVDLNHDGKINDGTELFTPNFGGGHFASGAAALTSLDSNHDGVIDHNDAAFSSLLIWKDANANGTSDAGELSSLADNGVASISTAAHPAVGEIDGQALTGNGTFQMTDGTSGNYIEVELDTSLVAPAQPSVASDGTRTFAIGSLEVADLIADFHDGANGDKIDLSSLLKGLAGVTDLEAGGFVEISQSLANAANAEVKVDTNGGGDNYHTVAVLENYTFHSAAEAVKILYDDSHGTKTDVA